MLIKICDFDFAKNLSDDAENNKGFTVQSRMTGTPGYTSFKYQILKNYSGLDSDSLMTLRKKSSCLEWFLWIYVSCFLRLLNVNPSTLMLFRVNSLKISSSLTLRRLPFSGPWPSINNFSRYANFGNRNIGLI